MNSYGRTAQKYWQQYAPEQYAQIQDPESYFSTLGTSVANRIADLQSQLAGNDQQDETHLDKVGRLNMARLRAEEVVMREDVWIFPEAHSSQDQDDPAWAAANTAYAAAEREILLEGWHEE